MKYRIVERVVEGVGLYVVQGGFDDCGYKNIGEEHAKLSEAYTAIRNLKYNAGEYEERIIDFDM
jgi:hypothetical protein